MPQMVIERHVAKCAVSGSMMFVFHNKKATKPNLI